jgi:hypothetical protein
MSESAHAGKSIRCAGETGETNDHGNPVSCGRTLTFGDDGGFVRVDPRPDGFEAGALRFDCPDCGSTHWLCPVCSDQDGENSPPGWFRGDSTRELIACHNCNAAEAARQQRGRF